MSEMATTRKALDYALKELSVMADGVGENPPNPIAIQTLRTIDAILNPPEEFEEVEVACYQVLSQRGSRGAFFFEGEWALAKQCCLAGEEPVKLTGTIKRPVKRAVVREVEVEARITEWDDGTGTSGKAISVHNPTRFPFADFDECHGKTGTLIFRWTE